MILKKLDLRKEALEMFVDAVHQAPCNWGAWQELSTLCTDRETVGSEGRGRAGSGGDGRGGDGRGWVEQGGAGAVNTVHRPGDGGFQGRSRVRLGGVGLGRAGQELSMLRRQGDGEIPGVG